MVLELILKERWVDNIPIYAFFLGVIFTSIGAMISSILFLDVLSIAMIFLISLFIIPSLSALLVEEAKEGAIRGSKALFKDHIDIFQTYLFLFLGIFLFFAIIGTFIPLGSYMQVFAYQIVQLNKIFPNFSQTIQGLATGPLQSQAYAFSSIIKNNMIVNILTFALSLLYGAGAMFIIVLNASIFGAAISGVIRSFAFGFIDKAAELFIIITIISLHLIPEVAAYLLAAIAGGILSKGLLVEKFMSERFIKLTKDSLTIFAASIILVIIAAFIEVFITSGIL